MYNGDVIVLCGIMLIERIFVVCAHLESIRGMTHFFCKIIRKRWKKEQFLKCGGLLVILKENYSLNGVPLLTDKI